MSTNDPLGIKSFLSGAPPVASEPDDDPNEQALNDPRVTDFLDRISRSEGADYNTLVGGSRVDDLQRHPNKVGLRTEAGPSTAFGRYQITGTTNREKLAKYLKRDYTPRNQDLRAVELLRQKGALDRILADDPQGAMKLAGGEWASIPGSTLPGRKNTAAWDFGGGKRDPADPLGIHSFIDSQPDQAAAAPEKPELQTTGLSVAEREMMDVSNAARGLPPTPVEKIRGVTDKYMQMVDAGAQPGAQPEAPAAPPETQTLEPAAPDNLTSYVNRPDLTQQLARDLQWHFGMSDPNDFIRMRPKQQRRMLKMLADAVADDERKKAQGITLARSLSYQNEMRKKVGLGENPEPVNANARMMAETTGPKNYVTGEPFRLHIDNLLSHMPGYDPKTGKVNVNTGPMLNEAKLREEVRAQVIRESGGEENVQRVVNDRLQLGMTAKAQQVEDHINAETEKRVQDALTRAKTLQSRQGRELPELGFLDAIHETKGRDLVPFLSSGAGIYDALTLKSRVDRFMGGNPEQQDLLVIQELIDRQRQKTTIGYDVANILTAMPAFVGEFVATGGTYALGRAAAEQAAKQFIKKLATEAGREALEKLVKRKAVQLGVKIGTGLVGAAAQTIPAAGLRIASGTIERMTPKIQALDVKEGDVKGFSAEPGESFAQALRDSATDQYIEIASERAGGLLEHIPLPKRLAAIRDAVSSRWIKAVPGRTQKQLRAIVERTGWNGVLGEMFEERVADVAKYATGLQPNLVPSLQQLIAEGIGFSVPGAANFAANTAVDRLTGRRPETEDSGDRTPEPAQPPTPQTPGSTLGLDEVTPETLQAKLEAHAAKRAPAQPPTPEMPRAPEAPQTVEAQFDAIGRGERRAVVLEPGTALPEAASSLDLHYFQEGDGPRVFFDPAKISREKVARLVAEGRINELIGHVEPESPSTTRVVVARSGVDAGRVKTGDELMSSYVTPGNEGRQQAEMQSQFGPLKPTFESGGAETAESVLSDRATEAQKQPETIVTAAIRTDSDNIVTGKNHPQILLSLGRKVPKDRSGPEYGFITSTGRFVDRAEAARIAGIPNTIAPGQLYTEDLTADRKAKEAASEQQRSAQLATTEAKLPSKRGAEGETTPAPRTAARTKRELTALRQRVRTLTNEHKRLFREVKKLPESDPGYQDAVDREGAKFLELREAEKALEAAAPQYGTQRRLTTAPLSPVIEERRKADRRETDRGDRYEVFTPERRFEIQQMIAEAEPEDVEAMRAMLAGVQDRLEKGRERPPTKKEQRRAARVTEGEDTDERIEGRDEPARQALGAESNAGLGTSGESRAARPETEAAQNAPDAPALQTSERSEQDELDVTEHVDGAAHEAATSPTNDLPEPSQAQRDAGNYQMGHTRVAGLNLTIEIPEGGERTGVDKTGKAWAQRLFSHYGYIKRSEGSDGEQVDVFVRPGTPLDYEGPVFIVNQNDAEGEFDEHKVMLGFADTTAARIGYLQNYQAGWDRVGSIARMGNVAAFKSWLEDGDMSLPAQSQNALEEGDANARTVRTDQGLVSGERQATEDRQAPGGTDVHQEGEGRQPVESREVATSRPEADEETEAPAVEGAPQTHTQRAKAKRDALSGLLRDWRRRLSSIKQARDVSGLEAIVAEMTAHQEQHGLTPRLTTGLTEFGSLLDKVRALKTDASTATLAAAFDAEFEAMLGASAVSEPDLLGERFDQELAAMLAEEAALVAAQPVASPEPAAQAPDERLERAAREIQAAYEAETRKDFFKVFGTDKTEADLQRALTGSLDRARASARHLITFIDDKNTAKLIEWLHTSNKASRRIFERETGVDLGSTNKSARAAIDNWATGRPIVAAPKQTNKEKRRASMLEKAPPGGWTDADKLPYSSSRLDTVVQKVYDEANHSEPLTVAVIGRILEETSEKRLRQVESAMKGRGIVSLVGGKFAAPEGAAPAVDTSNEPERLIPEGYLPGERRQALSAELAKVQDRLFDGRNGRLKKSHKPEDLERQRQIKALMRAHNEAVVRYNVDNFIFTHSRPDLNHTINGGGIGPVDQWEVNAPDGKHIGTITHIERRGFVANSVHLQNGAFDTLQEAKIQIIARNVGALHLAEHLPEPAAAAPRVLPEAERERLIQHHLAASVRASRNDDNTVQTSFVRDYNRAVAIDLMQPLSESQRANRIDDANQIVDRETGLTSERPSKAAIAALEHLREDAAGNNAAQAESMAEVARRLGASNADIAEASGKPAPPPVQTAGVTATALTTEQASKLAELFPTKPAKPDDAQFALAEAELEASVYDQVKPYFEAGTEHHRDKTPVEALKALMRELRDVHGFQLDQIAGMKPYIIRFVQDLAKAPQKVAAPAKKAENRLGESNVPVDQKEPVRDRKRGDADQRPGPVQGTEDGRDAATSVRRPGGRRDGSARPSDVRGADKGDAGRPGTAITDSAAIHVEPPGRGDSDLAGHGISYPSDAERDSAHQHDYIAPEGSLTRQGSWRETARTNLDILELVKKLEAEDRLATPDEQALLVRFTGWGATEIANNLFPGTQYGKPGQRRIMPEYARDAAWRELAERAKNLFTQEELEAALSSTQYAHYTSEAIIRGVWSALNQFGFTEGKILEPGMGIGLFASAAPRSVMQRSRYTGIEREPLTAAIAKHVLQRQVVMAADFVKQKLPPNFFDVAIGNPPFARGAVTDDPKYRKYRFLLHDYFFAKSIDSVRPGGLLVFVTSHGTMDKGDAKMREYIAERADLLGAIRLPQTAFKHNAGTEVVTDVLFLRKRVPDEEASGEAWVGRGEVTGPRKYGEDKTAPISEYFVAHPEMVLGKHAFTGTMRGADEYTVEPIEGDIEQLFREAVEKLPSGVYQHVAKTQDIIRTVSERDWSPDAKKEGSLYLDKNGQLRRLENGSGVVLRESEPVSPSAERWLTSHVQLRQALKQAQLDQNNDGDWEASLAELNRQYDKFVKKHGRITDFTQRERTFVDEDGVETVRFYRTYKNQKLLRLDVESPLVEALEKVNEDGTIEKGAMLLRRTIKPPAQVVIRTLSDALAVSLDQLGTLNVAHVAELMAPVQKMSRQEVIAELGDAIYEAPGGAWQMADEYLSGYVIDKLEEAEAAARLDRRFERNVEALRKVQPRPLEANNIGVALGATWIPQEVVSQFAKESLGFPADSISFERLRNEWTVEGAQGSGSRSRRSAAETWGTVDRSPQELLSAALNGHSVKVYVEIEKGKKQLDEAASTAANEVVKKMRDAFKSWIWTDAERTQSLVARYNRQFNNIAARQFNGDHLTLPGLSAVYNLHQHQKRAVWRQLQTGNTYLGHAVGAGKTLEMIVGAMEQRRLGLIRKPMFTVPNHMLKQFSAEFLDAYPMANILVADEESFSKERRKRFVAQTALNDIDAVIITHSAFGLIRTRPETSDVIVNELVSQLLAAIDELDESDRAQKRTIKELEARIETITRRFQSKAADESRDDVVDFEDLGVDFLYVDEAHVFRKLVFVTNRDKIKGVDPIGSRRALDLFIKTRYLESQRPGRSMVFASGTPITNTLAELYSIQRYMDSAGLEAAELSHFDAWAAQFGEVHPDYEMNAAGKYELVERFSRFINIPELMKRVRQFMDVLTMKQLSSLINVPTIKGGAPEVVVVPPSAQVLAYLKDVLEPRIKASRDWKPSFAEPFNPDPLINIITDGRLASVDMRFIYPNSENDPNSKLNKMIDTIIEHYHRDKGIEYVTYSGEGAERVAKPDAIKGAAQIIFSAVGFGKQVAKTRGFDAKKWIIKRLTEGGIPASELAFMSDHKTATAKQQLFKDMRLGVKRELIGSPQNMGTGVNAQKRLKTLHYLSPPWFPADVEQPDGRIIRQGNQNPEVELKRYATKGTYDSTAWQMIARKSRSIEQAMMGDDSQRTLEDITESSLYEMASALAAGDARAIELAGLRRDVEKLNRLRSAHFDEQSVLRGDAGRTERNIEGYKKEIGQLKTAIDLVGGFVSANDFHATIAGTEYEKRGEMGTALTAEWSRVVEDNREKAIKSKLVVKAELNARVLGKFKLIARIDAGAQGVMSDLDLLIATGVKKNIGWRVGGRNIPEQDPVGIATRVFNALNLQKELSDTEATLNNSERELKMIKSKLGREFAEEGDLYEKTAQLNRLQAEMAGEAEKAPEAAAEVEQFADSGDRTPEGWQTADAGAVEPAPELRVEGNRVIFTGSQPSTLLGKVFKRRVGGVFLRKTAPMELVESLTQMEDPLAHHLAGAVRQAAQGSKAVIITAQGRLVHEMFHESMEGLGVDVSTLTKVPAFASARAKLIQKQYPDDPNVLVSEAAAYIAEGKYEEIGMTNAEATAWLTLLFDSVMDRNPGITPDRFRELSNVAQEALKAALYRQENKAEVRSTEQRTEGLSGRREQRTERPPGFTGVVAATDRQARAAIAGYRNQPAPSFAGEQDEGANQLTQTPAFKRWFGDSKVLDKQGNPLVVYHRSPFRFTAFDPEEIRHFGFHFGSRAQARQVNVGEGRGHLYPVYLRLENPLRLDDLGDWGADRVVRELRRLNLITEEQVGDVEESYDPDGDLHKILNARGYDGIVYENIGERQLTNRKHDTYADSYIAFDPTQIKSATKNKGTFDPTNPDIRFALEDDPWAEFDEMVGSLEQDIDDEMRRMSGQRERALPLTLEAAELEPGENLIYDPETIEGATEAGRQAVTAAGIDESIGKVLHGDPDINWAATGFAILTQLRVKSAGAAESGDASEAQRLRDRMRKFAEDFAERATKLGQAIAGIRAVENFAPDRMVYLARKLSKERRGRDLSVEQEERITYLAEELQKMRDRNMALHDRLERAQAEKKARAVTQRTLRTLKPRVSPYQATLNTRAATILQTLKPKVGKLDFGNLGEQFKLKHPKQEGTVGDLTSSPTTALPGDAELLAEYAASRLSELRTVAELNDELIREFGEEVRPFLRPIRQRAYTIRQEARATEMAARETTSERRSTILSEIRQELADGEREAREVEQQQQRADRERQRAADRQDRADARDRAQQTRRQQRREQRQLATEARERRDQARQEYQEARQAETQGWRQTLRDRRRAARRAQLWDTPLRDAAAEARTRLLDHIAAYPDTAAPVTDDTVNDLVSVGASMLLPETPGGAARVRSVSPSRVYRDLKRQFPGLVSRRNQSRIFQRAFQRVQDTISAAREAARMRAANNEVTRLWEDQGIDVDQQAILIQQSEVRRQQTDTRHELAREFRRVSRGPFRRFVFEAQAFVRAMRSSIDAPLFRQNIINVLAYPIRTARVAVPATWRGYTSDIAMPRDILQLIRNPITTWRLKPWRRGEFQAEVEDLRSHPRYELSQLAGLDLPDLPSAGTDPEIQAEEEYQSTLAEKFPHVRMSEQGFVLPMNWSRLDTFARWSDRGEAHGYTWENNPEFFEQAAHVVNAITGRGNLPDALKRVSAYGNLIFYSVRLNVARLQALHHIFDPFAYYSYDPVMRRIVAGLAIRLVFALAGIGLVAHMLGFGFSLDPDDDDFFKLKVGNTRYDVTGGHAGHVRFMFRFVRGILMMAAGYEVPRHKDPLHLISLTDEGSFVRQKYAPIPGMTVDFIKRKNVIGQPVTGRGLLLDSFKPMVVDDFVDAAMLDGWVGVVKTLPALGGMGVATYSDNASSLMRDKAKEPAFAAAVKEMQRLRGKGFSGEVHTPKQVEGEPDDSYRARTLAETAAALEEVNRTISAQWYKDLKTREEKQTEIKAAIKAGRDKARSELNFIPPERPQTQDQPEQ